MPEGTRWRRSAPGTDIHGREYEVVGRRPQGHLVLEGETAQGGTSRVIMSEDRLRGRDDYEQIQDPPEPDPAPTRDWRSEARSMFPWLQGELLDLFVSEYQQHGNSEAALGAVRQSSAYAQHFPGNIRDDGTIRLRETEYLSRIEGYEQVLLEYGVPPGEVSERFPELIEGGVGVRRLEDRVGALYTNIASRSDEIRQAYADYFGITNLSDAAILTSALRPDRSIAEIENNIRQAQIGGRAMEAGFDLDAVEAERLQQHGLEEEAARRLFRSAQQRLPRLSEMAARHDDPDDDFTLTDFTDALVLEEPDSIRRLGRLVGQETAAFSPGIETQRGQAGEILGLERR